MITQLADDIWFFPYELKVLGIDIRRNVTLIRLKSGRLIIHSTAKFSQQDIEKIREIGEPGWIVEGMIDHDTFSTEGRVAFPEIPFFAPEGFQDRVDFPVETLNSPPTEWSDEIEVIAIKGIPKMAECVFFHHASGTLIVCDLLFHFPEFSSLWEKMLLMPALGFHPAPGFSQRVKMSIKDRVAFGGSLEEILALPIQRVIPGHGVVLEKDAKVKARNTFERSGLL